MKQFYGMRSRLFKRLRGKVSRNRFEYAMTLKIGDLVQTCSGFNSRITGIKYRWRPYKKHGHFLNDIQFTDDLGRWHYWNTCCEEAWSSEQVTAFFKEDTPPEEIQRMKNGGWWDDTDDRIYKALADGKPICDKNGIMLPEIRYNLLESQKDFDEMYARMQTPESKAGIKAFWESLKTGE